MKVRLTESKLKQIVAESVRKVLSEGKLKNNEPLFMSPRHKWAKPGEYADTDQYDEMEKIFREEPSLPNKDLVNSFIAKKREGISKHNDRAKEKYEYDSDNSSIRDIEFKPLFGDEYVDDLYRKKRNDRKRFSRMLQYNGISYEDFKNSSEEQQHYYWMNYNHPNDGDPNWDDLITRAYGRPRYYDEY